MSTAIVSPLPAHDPNAHALPDAVIEDSVDTVANTQDADEMSAHAQAQAHRVRAATVGNPVVSAAGGLRSPGKPNTTPSPARSVSFVNGAQGQAQAGAGERESAGTSTGDVDGSPRLPVSADGRAKAAALVSGDVGKSTGGAGLDGTTHGTGQMGAMASEPDLVHDVSYDRNRSPTMSMPDLPTTSGPAASSQVSLATSSIGGDASVSPKRQIEFERYFRDQLALAGDRVGPDDLTVVATQSADLQAKILIHGRLYLTRSYLCFRANILGFKTEKIHRVRDMMVVEKSTTAKWIQNAVSITMERLENGELPEEADDTTGRVFGYGSMADRDAMYEQLAAFWKEQRPERYEQHQRRRAESVARRAAATRDDDLGTIKEDAAVEGAATRAEDADSSGSETADEATGAKETQDSGERYKELALDVKLPVKPQALFDLIYHNEDFTMDFLKNVQKLTDVEVSDWQKSTEGQSRGLTYVMHMNNKIGPSKSDCIGEEVIVIEDPEKSFEIKSSTQTPDVPSGKSFKIHTRTNITHSPYHGRPGTRLFCTTQCDWSSSSWLKGTITPAVISGQKEYHQKLLKAVRKWIRAHPQDFEVEEGGGDETDGEGGDDDDDTQKGVGEVGGSGASVQVQGAGGEKNLFDQAMEIPNSPLMLGITLVCVLSLILNYYLLFSRGKAVQSVVVPAPPPREL